MKNNNDDKQGAEAGGLPVQAVPDLAEQFANLYNMHSNQHKSQSSSENRALKPSIIMQSNPPTDVYYIDVSEQAWVLKEVEASIAKLPKEFKIKSEVEIDGSHRFFVLRP